MSLFRWRCWRFAAARPAFLRAGACVFLLAGGLAQNARAQIPSPSEVRVYIGYVNQRADLSPGPHSALDGVAVSLERLVSSSAGSLLLDIRGGFRPGPPLCVGGCDPTAHQMDNQILLLAGIRTSVHVRGGRVFFDGLGGVGYMETGWDNGGSPVAEGGVGFEAPIGPRVDARVRASMLFSDFDDDRWQGWRHHIGLSAGIVLRPGE